MKLNIAIDPGVTGAIAWRLHTMEGGSSEVDVVRMPETDVKIARHLRELLHLPADILVVIEKVGHGIPGQSSVATATFARHVGVLHGILAALEVPTMEITPQEWMKGLGLMGARPSMKGLDKKEKARLLYRYTKERKAKIYEAMQKMYPSLYFGEKEADALGLLTHHLNQTHGW